MRETVAFTAAAEAPALGVGHEPELLISARLPGRELMFCTTVVEGCECSALWSKLCGLLLIDQNCVTLCGPFVCGTGMRPALMANDGGVMPD